MEELRVTARPAKRGDLPVLVHLYRDLEKEMTTFHSMWPLADGLAEPVEDSFAALLEDPEALVVVGELDGFPLGLAVARLLTMLPQAGEGLVGSIEMVFVEQEAREVGLGEAILDLVLDRLRARGVSKFDARVLPRSRVAKNFFEAGGFAARSITMHHDDAED